MNIIPMHEHVHVQLSNDGSVVSAVAAVSMALRQAGLAHEAKHFVEKALLVHSYQEALDLCALTVTIALEAPTSSGNEPITLIEPVSPATPDDADTVPGYHLDWPDLDTVSDSLDDDPCPWKASGYL